MKGAYTMFNFLLDTTESTVNPVVSALMWIIPIAAILLMFWFSSKSRKKREKEVADMRDSLQPGDEVTTIGGIIGKVVSVKGETFVLETTKDKTKIRFLKAAINSVDVKASDVAAQVMEAKEAPAEEVAPEEPAAEEEKPEKKKKSKKKKDEDK